jgi:hypothetical protein
MIIKCQNAYSQNNYFITINDFHQKEGGQVDFKYFDFT